MSNCGPQEHIKFKICRADQCVKKGSTTDSQIHINNIMYEIPISAVYIIKN
jgi:hypothetical protein